MAAVSLQQNFLLCQWNHRTCGRERAQERTTHRGVLTNTPRRRPLYHSGDPHAPCTPPKNLDDVTVTDVFLANGFKPTHSHTNTPSWPKTCAHGFKQHTLTHTDTPSWPTACAHGFKQHTHPRLAHSVRARLQATHTPPVGLQRAPSPNTAQLPVTPIW